MNGILRKRVEVIGSPIDAVTWDEAIERIHVWARARESRVVCICNVHSVVTARSDSGFSAVIRDADMATADGFPVALMLRRLGVPGQERINGPDLMLRYCRHVAAASESIYLYGGSVATLDVLRRRLLEACPGLMIAGAYSPPYRELTPDEDAAIVAKINASGAGVVWVGLGCPKQEKWMADHRGRINAVMIGVGAAFDYHAGIVKRAPPWMQRRGLEWFYRLVTEPRRLWRRYLVTNSLFIWHVARQLFGWRASGERPDGGRST
ncbi:WecB/TagA/CpsF family glycosyltransferase [Aerolutibacter daejeonensis]|uniref:WecB/TagA/CpsF family glycosyltransferase n=1 Tax=Aerolutibacter daejeonensis TaxID=346181 RepID=UPI00056203B6|nr:WecB/TagA/CpsF family glycosyltransferase [Lysobacter daejeonensis]